MSKNKSIFNTTTLLIGAGLLGAYLVTKKMNEPKERNGTGSLGGTDDLLGQQGFDIDPNSVPNNQPVDDYTYYVITPEGQVVPNETPTAGTDNGSGIPSNVPIASTGTGTLFQDASAVGGALGANLLLPSVAKRINKLIDTKYISDMTSLEKQTPWQKFIRDPYAINDLAVSKAEKSGTREIAELAITAEGKTVLKTVPKWAKGVKTVANFIPLLDIPIGAGLDVYFAKYEEDPNKKIDWWSAIKANTAGELAQLGITGGAAAVGTVVPVAGNIAGGIGGFVVGTSADIAATELYYKQMGKTSLFSGDSSKTQSQPLTAAQTQAQQNLFSQLGINTSANPFTSSSNGATYDSSTQTYTSASGAKQSMAATAPQAQAATKVSSSGGSSSLPAIFQPAANPFTSSGSSSSSSSSSNKSTPTNSTSSNVTKSSSAPVSSAPKSAPATAPKTSVVSNVSNAVKSAVSSVASKVSSFFGRGKKK